MPGSWSLGVPAIDSLATAPVPSRTPPGLPDSRPLPVIIGPVLPPPPPCWTPLVESGVADGVVIDGPVAPPACGEALGFEPTAWAARLQASKSAWVGWAADASAATANELTMTATVNNVFMDPCGTLPHQGTCRRVRLSAAKSPLDRAKEVGLEPAIRPDSRLVPEGRVDDAAAAVRLGPRERVVTIGTLATANVDGAWIEAQQNVNRRARPRAQLIDLVSELEAFAQVARGGVRPILDDEPCTLVPRVTVEGPAQELMVLRHCVPGIRRTVHADESGAVTNGLEDRVARHGRHRQLAGREEENGAMGSHVCGGEPFDLFAGGNVSDVEATGTPSQVKNDPLCRRQLRSGRTPHDVVLVSRRVRHDEHPRRRRPHPRGRQHECCSQQQDCHETAARAHLGRFYPVRSRAFVPGTVLHRRGEPDALVVLLEDALARDLLLRAHPRVLRLGRTRIVTAVQVRRRDQAPHARAAARAGLERRVLHAVSGLVDDPAGRTLVFVGRHDVLPERPRAAGDVRRPPGQLRRRRGAAAPSARRWSWS